MKNIKWHKVAEFENEFFFGENNITVVDVSGKKMCLAKFQDCLYAFALKCPHAGGELADGFVDAIGNVVCPMHRYRFSLKNGYNVSGEGYNLKTWPVEQREDGIYIGLEETGLFGWR